MPDEYEKVADKMWERMKDRFDEKFEGCTTEACRRAKAEAEEVYNRVITEGDDKTMQELGKFNANLDKVFEEIEKAQEGAEAEDVPCPHCEYDGDEKPKRAGKCPDGCIIYDEYDKKQGLKKCGICGEDIDWDDEE